MKFLTSYFVVLFVLKLTKNAIFNVPSVIKRHYSTASLRTLRQLERLKRKHVKRLCDIHFLKTCILYNLKPSMTRFKLQNPSAEFSKPYRSYQNKLLRDELRSHVRRAEELQKSITTMENGLYPTLSWLHRSKVAAFLQQSVPNNALERSILRSYETWGSISANHRWRHAYTTPLHTSSPTTR